MEVLREVKVSSLAIAFASIRIASKVPQVLTSHSYYPDYSQCCQLSARFPSHASYIVIRGILKNLAVALKMSKTTFRKNFLLGFG
jgi:hypothetical protein